MKSLHYSIIAISLIGISFSVSENVYGCLGNCPPIIPPPHYAFPPITVHTNLENYSTGDNIVITGHIFNQTKDTPLIIKIFDPIRQFQFDKNVPVLTNGNYTWTLSTVDFWSFDASGNYTALAQYGQVYAITNFNLNSTLTQYLYSQSPLWQFKNGMPAQDVHCHTGFTLIVRKENFAPACTNPITATHLILNGWALETAPMNPFISSLGINGLQQNYTVSHPIDATINYAGYWSGAWEPDIKIFDANDTQIWFNCPRCVENNNDVVLGGGPSIPSYGNFTYHVQDYNGHSPVINETGTYTMITSLGNKTASARFDVIPNTNENDGKNTLSNLDSNGPDFKVGPDILGPLPHQLVFFMKSNSTARIFVEYTSHEPNTGTVPSYSSVYVVKGGDYAPLTTSDVTINAHPSSIPLTEGSDTIVVYKVTAKEGVKGVYWITLAQFCGVIPLAVDVNSLTISPFDIPVQTGIMHCPAQLLDRKILGISEGTAEYKIGSPVK